jgi:teichuronic acid biosynthesis glycosyltransferase TuaG
MLISVIVPFHNELNSIDKAVCSVFEQVVYSSHNVEFQIIISNDGEIDEDNIFNVISSRFSEKVTIVNNTYQKGPGGARNTALDLAIGDYIAFLDADDYWDKDKISLYIDHLTTGFNFVCSGYFFSDANVLIEPCMNVDSPSDIFSKLGVGTSTVVISRELLGDLRFNDIRFSQDIDFWYRLALQETFNFKSINKGLTVYSRGGSTRNKFTQIKYFHYVLNLNKIPFTLQATIMTRYIVRGVYNHYLKGLFK